MYADTKSCLVVIFVFRSFNGFSGDNLTILNPTPRLQVITDPAVSLTANYCGSRASKRQFPPGKVVQFFFFPGKNLPEFCFQFQLL